MPQTDINNLDLVTPTAARPESIDSQPDSNTYELAAVLGDLSLGGLVVVELINPANSAAIYTVPANKVFTGRLFLRLMNTSTVASIGATAANEGALGKIAAASQTPLSRAYDIIDITCSNGASTDAITATVTGSAQFASVTLIGHVL